MECLRVMINDVAMDGCDSMLEMISRADTPVTVLHAARSRSASESDPTVGSKSDDSDAKKRRTAVAAARSGRGLKPNKK